jgi:hypothetical protein
VFEIACRATGLFCVVLSTAGHPSVQRPVDDGAAASACATAAGQDAAGEVVSVAVGDFVLHAGDFGPEIFLRGPDGHLGYTFGGFTGLEARCRALLSAVPGLVVSR